MNDELEIIKGLLPQMAGVMNVVPGEPARLKESDTLLILQRRMKESDLQRNLEILNQVYAEPQGASMEKLSKAAVAYVKIKVLSDAGEVDFTPRSLRTLIKEYKSQMTKVTNIIHLSKVNAMTADDYQKELIVLTEQKNESFLAYFETEIELLEKRIERLPVEEEEQEVNLTRSKKASEITKAEKKPEKQSLLSKLEKRMLSTKEKKNVEEHLKNVEKASAISKCVEIPFYDKSLSYTELIPCKDIPAYSLMKRKNNVYFGLSKNVGKTAYNNQDQSLIELTEATEEFLQFMSENLLSEEFNLQIFSEKEKQGLVMYFNFMSKCFENHIGVTLTVQEYLRFKIYYNKLVQKMMDLEKEKKKAYRKAWGLVEEYLAYMDSYDLECSDEQETMIENIINENSESYLEDLQMIISHHVVDENAKEDLQNLSNRIEHFNKPEEKKQEVVIAEPEPIRMPYENLQMYPQMMGIPQVGMQIVIQILNQNRELVDEALYAGNNVKQALYDFATKDAEIKRLGFRNNGTDVFYREEIKEG